MSIYCRIVCLFLFLVSVFFHSFAQAFAADSSETRLADLLEPAGLEEGLSQEMLSKPVVLSHPSPVFYNLSVNDTYSTDTEIALWVDGKVSLPVKFLAALLEMSPQQSEESGMIFFTDPDDRRQIQIDYVNGVIKVNDAVFDSNATHPAFYSTEGLAAPNDVFIDQAVVEKLLHVKFELNEVDLTVSMTTSRNLAVLTEENVTASNDYLKPLVIDNPEVVQQPIEKVFVNYSNSAFYQVVNPLSAMNPNVYNTIFVNTLGTGVKGTILGHEYYVKPSFLRFNGHTNFMDLDWNIKHEGKTSQIDLGKLEVGLSTLVSPTMQIYGLRYARQNALQPNINTDITTRKKQEISLEVSTKDAAALQQEGDIPLAEVTLNDEDEPTREVSKKSEQDEYFHPVSSERRLFPELLPAHEKAYSTFIGRTPFQFNPIEVTRNIPILAPQTEKWLAGGRAFYGVNNKLTVGISAAADRNFGKPRTYFLLPTPLFVDLTSLSSYYRDPNFFDGESVALTSNYALSKRVLLSADAGVSGYRLQAGSNLPLAENGADIAGRAEIRYQGDSTGLALDAFHYGTKYYTPSTQYSNSLYDRQGVGIGLNGPLPFFPAVSYYFRVEALQSNLSDLIPGGRINSTHWMGTLNRSWGHGGGISMDWNWILGESQEREYIQKNTSATIRQKFIWDIDGQASFRNYVANFIQVPVSDGNNITIVNSSNRYENNVLDINFKIPVFKSKNKNNSILLGHWLSTFSDYYYARGNFQYKNIYFEPYIQKSYGNKQQVQDSIGFRTGYQFKNGGRLGISLYRNNTDIQVAGIPVIKNSGTQFFVDFADVLGILAHRIKSLGTNGDNMSAIVGSVFADINQNGKREPSEPGIADTSFIVDGEKKTYTTNAQGEFTLHNLFAGPHSLALNNAELPITLTAPDPLYQIKVKAGKIHKLNIPLHIESGIVSGDIRLTDSTGNVINPSKLILVLKDKSGRVVQYTTSDDAGHFRIENLSPGEYILDLESKAKLSGRYRLENDPIPVEIPFSMNFDEPIEKSGLAFHVLKL